MIFVIGLTIFTQVIIPAFIKGLPFFWIFKYKSENPYIEQQNTDLNQEVEELKKMDEEVGGKVRENHKEAEDILNKYKETKHFN